MMYWSSGWSAAGDIAMMVGMIAVTVLIAGGIWLLLRPVFGRTELHRTELQGSEIGDPGFLKQELDSGLISRGSGLEVLNRRYARGEIDREDYLRRRRDLLDQSQEPGTESNG